MEEKEECGGKDAIFRIKLMWNDIEDLSNTLSLNVGFVNSE